MPEIKKGFEESVENIGAFVALNCLVAGNPVPSITWSVDNTIIKEDSHVYVKYDTDGKDGINTTLFITNAKKNDGGMYTCEASNHLGKAKHMTRVNIYGMFW